MENKNRLSQPPFVQVFILLGLWFFGLIVSTFIVTLFFSMEELKVNASAMRIALIIQSTFMFLVPASIYSALHNKIGEKNIFTEAPIKYKKIGLGILLLIVAYPFISLIAYYNANIDFSFISEKLQESIKASELANQEIIQLLTKNATPLLFFFNFITIALVPGVVEELFFRGCIQKSLYKSKHGGHYAVWITALIFSVLHFQLTGLITRILLGALLGYIYYYSKNIFVPIITHVFNNTMVLVVLYLSEIEKYSYLKDLENSIIDYWYLAIPSIILSVVILLIFKKENKTKKAHKE